MIDSLYYSSRGGVKTLFVDYKIYKKLCYSLQKIWTDPLDSNNLMGAKHLILIILKWKNKNKKMFRPIIYYIIFCKQNLTKPSN